MEGVHGIFDAANDHFYGSFGLLQYLGNEVRKRDLSRYLGIFMFQSMKEEKEQNSAK